MTLQFLGHSCFLMQFGDTQVLLDPFVNSIEEAKPYDKGISPDYILLTHAHEDHVRDTERYAARKNATVISNYEIANHFGHKGLNHLGMNHGGELILPFGIIKMFHAIHSSSFADGSYGGNPAAYIISTPDLCFYISGDTDLHYDMKLIPELGYNLDFAILCIGDHFTMNYKSACVAADFIKCNDIIACHFDTFPNIIVDRNKAKDLFLQNNKKLSFMKIGELKEI